MIEEVKGILKSKMALEQCDPDVMPYFTDYYWIPVDQIMEFAQQICQLFPPYQDAQWSDIEGKCFWCKSSTHWVDICYYDYVCSAKCQREIAEDVKSKSQLFPKTEGNPDGFEQEPDEIDQLARAQYAYETGHPERELEPKPNGLLKLEEVIGVLEKANMNYKPSREHYLELNSDIELRAMLKAQRDLTASIVRAEKDNRYKQAIKDAREGKKLDLDESEFEIFSTIQNLNIIAKDAEYGEVIIRLVKEMDAECNKKLREMALNYNTIQERVERLLERIKKARGDSQRRRE